MSPQSKKTYKSRYAYKQIHEQGKDEEVKLGVDNLHGHYIAFGIVRVRRRPKFE
jgi:hypothetical protein